MWRKAIQLILRSTHHMSSGPNGSSFRKASRQPCNGTQSSDSFGISSSLCISGRLFSTKVLYCLDTLIPIDTDMQDTTSLVLSRLIVDHSLILLCVGYHPLLNKIQTAPCVRPCKKQLSFHNKTQQVIPSLHIHQHCSGFFVSKIVLGLYKLSMGNLKFHLQVTMTSDTTVMNRRKTFNWSRRDNLCLVSP